jgi:pimeloyl-ACP methyl ester carboxylesterase
MRIPFLTLPLYMTYYPKWEPRRPADFAAHAAALRANLGEPERRNVIKAYLFQQTHRAAERRLPQVMVPSLVIMGTADVDWADPAAEANWIAAQLGSGLLMLDGTGHHPHIDCAPEIAEEVTAFAWTLSSARQVKAGQGSAGRHS